MLVDEVEGTNQLVESCKIYLSRELSTLAANELEDLLTNNLVTERDLSRFNREAQVAKSRNRQFKVKNIRNNMVLYKKQKVKLQLIRFPKRYITEILNQHEERWNQSQHEKLKQRLEEKLKKSVRAKDYT